MQRRSAVCVDAGRHRHPWLRGYCAISRSAAYGKLRRVPPQPLESGGGAADEKGSTDVSALGRKRLLTWFNRVWIKPAWIKDDSGVAALVLAAVIAVIAFTALTIFLGKFLGGRELARLQSSSSSEGRFVSTVYTAFLRGGSPYTLPCPDSAATPTGVAALSGQGRV